MLDNQSIRRLFGKDKAHFAIIEYNLRECEDSIVYAETDGVLMYLKEEDMALLYGFNKDRAKEVCEESGIKPQLVFCSSCEEREACCELFGFKNVKECWQVLYEKSADIKAPKNTEIIKMAPTKENLEFIYSRHNNGETESKIREILQGRGFYAAVTDGKISGFISTHDEGAIGFLFVEKEFRKMGIGSYLVDYMIKKLSSEGKVAYANVITDNEASYRMHLKMGYIPSDKKVYWCL